MDRIVKDITASRLNWRDILQQFMVQTAREDYSWNRPNRRYVHMGLHLPALASERVGSIAVAIDTSGSIDRKALQVFLGELQGVVDQVQPEKVVVYACDSRIKSREEFEAGEVVKPKTPGGGGTEFLPVFEALLQEDEEPMCLIYFTDGQAEVPPDPGIPILWAMQGCPNDFRHTYHSEPTYGDIIYLEGGV